MTRADSRAERRPDTERDRAASVLVADDQASFRTLLERELTRRGFRITAVADGRAALAALEEREFDVLLLDVRMPGASGVEVLRKSRELVPPPEAVLLTGQATLGEAVEAMKLGAYDFIAKPSPLDHVEALLHGAAAKRAAVRANLRHERREAHGDRLVPSIWDSKAMTTLHATLERVAVGDVPVLLQGETGSGKEVVAREIHRLSSRNDRPFVDVNCGAIQDTLLESELFGYEKGAFTGADTSRPGLFEAADGGTLLLDEVGELPPALQVKLLRVLETMTFYRVGGRQKIQVDVRILAATNKDLAREVEAGGFRADLFYRINTVTLEVPPLRERLEDVPGLARAFLEAAAPGKMLDPEAQERLRVYRWPGNVRELKHVIERAALLATSDTLGLDDLPADIASGEGGPRPAPEPQVERSLSSHGPEFAGKADDAADPGESDEAGTLRDMERERIVEVLQQTRWNRGRAAEILGISSRTLYRRIKRYDLYGA